MGARGRRNEEVTRSLKQLERILSHEPTAQEAWHNSLTPSSMTRDSPGHESALTPLTLTFAWERFMQRSLVNSGRLVSHVELRHGKARLHQGYADALFQYERNVSSSFNAAGKDFFCKLIKILFLVTTSHLHFIVLKPSSRASSPPQTHPRPTFTSTAHLKPTPYAPLPT